MRLEVLEDPEGPIELFDLSTDPIEARDVAGEHSDVVARMTELMREAHAPSDLFPFPGDQP